MDATPLTRTAWCATSGTSRIQMTQTKPSRLEPSTVVRPLVQRHADNSTVQSGAHRCYLSTLPPRAQTHIQDSPSTANAFSSALRSSIPSISRLRDSPATIGYCMLPTTRATRAHGHALHVVLRTAKSKKLKSGSHTSAHAHSNGPFGTLPFGPRKW